MSFPQNIRLPGQKSFAEHGARQAQRKTTGARPRRFEALKARSEFANSNGDDCRNYGLWDGLPEMKRIFADMVGVPGFAGHSRQQLKLDDDV